MIATGSGRTVVGTTVDAVVGGAGAVVAAGTVVEGAVVDSTMGTADELHADSTSQSVRKSEPVQALFIPKPYEAWAAASSAAWGNLGLRRKDEAVS